MKKVCFVLVLAFLLTISTVLPSAVSAMEESSKDTKSEASELSFDKNSIQQKITNDQKDVGENSKIDNVLESKKLQEKQKSINSYDVKKQLQRVNSALKVEISEPLKIKRSQVVSKDFMDVNKTSAVNDAWGQFYAYATWKKAGIIDMLSKISVNSKNIAPLSGDATSSDQIYKAFNESGSVVSSPMLTNVSTCCIKARSVPTNLPLNVHPLLVKENTYTEPYTFTTDYSLDYSSYKPLFKNDFILIDDYRQLKFNFAVSNDGKTHGHFTGEEQLLSLGKYQDTKVPNNVVGVVEGTSLNASKLGIPKFELDEGWKIDKITDSEKKEYTEDEILRLNINENQNFTIHLVKEVKKVVVPAVWYPVDNDTNEVIPGLNPLYTYPDMYKDHPDYKDEVAVLNKNTGEYEISYMGIASPKEASEFQFTFGLWFTDRFHHIVAKGLTNGELDPAPQDGSTSWGRAKSSVRKIVYGDKIVNCPPDKKDYNAGKAYEGISGYDRTLYQEGKTMNLYVAVKIVENFLTEPTFKNEKVEILSSDEDTVAREKLKNHIESVEYWDFANEKANNISGEKLSKLFIYKYKEGDKTTGEFIGTKDGYTDFMSKSFKDLPAGEYEAVFPIYWEENIPDGFSGSVHFSRMRTKYSDTVHFSFTKKDTIHTITYNANGGKFPDDSNLKIGKYKEGEKITIIDAPMRQGYSFLYWEGSKHNPGDEYTVAGDHTFTAKWNKTPELEVKDTTINVGDELDLRTLIETAMDEEDGPNLIDKVFIDKGNFDSKKVGKYKVTFTLTDRDGASVTKEATITVKQKDKTPKLEPKKPSKKLPQTGDNSSLMKYIILLGLTGVVVFISDKKRKEL